MSIVLNPYARPDEWMDALHRLLPDDEIVAWPDVADPNAVEFVIAWRMPRADLQSYPNLRAILSLGAGAEQWQQPGVPEVPVVRLADPAMSDEVASAMQVATLSTTPDPVFPPHEVSAHTRKQFDASAGYTYRDWMGVVRQVERNHPGFDE